MVHSEWCIPSICQHRGLWEDRTCRVIGSACFQRCCLSPEWGQPYWFCINKPGSRQSTSLWSSSSSFFFFKHHWKTATKTSKYNIVNNAFPSHTHTLFSSSLNTSEVILLFCYCWSQSKAVGDSYMTAAGCLNYTAKSDNYFIMALPSLCSLSSYISLTRHFSQLAVFPWRAIAQKNSLTGSGLVYYLLLVIFRKLFFFFTALLSLNK